MRRILFSSFALLFLISFISAKAHAKPYDNRYCAVLSDADSADDFNSLRRKLEEGFNRKDSIRFCTEKVFFNPGAGFNIQLKSGLSIDNPNDLDHDQDGFGFILDGSQALNVEIHAEGLGSECAINVNADKVKLTGFSLYVQNYKKGICKASDELEVEDSGVNIVAADDLDKDRVPTGGEDGDNCPDKPNPLQENQDGDKFGDACDNCPTVKNDNQDADACAETPVPTANPTPTPTATPAATATPAPTASPTPTATPTPTTTPSATPGSTPIPSPTPIVVTPVDPTDKDGDTVLNENDNCPLISNPDQTDGDGDAIGDACDPNPAVAGSLSDGTVVDLDSGAGSGCSLINAGNVTGLAGFLVFFIPTLVSAGILRRKRR